MTQESLTIAPQRYDNAIGFGPEIQALGLREKLRDRGQMSDPICSDRLSWRSQAFRHLVHLLPGQTILELGCGNGLFTEKLVQVSRGENPITAVTFNASNPRPQDLPTNVHFINAALAPTDLSEQTFDFIVVMDLLDESNSIWFLQTVFNLLKPSGQVIFFESNPWNLVLRWQRLAAYLFGKKDPRRLLSRPKLYELMSEIGFLRIFSVYNDFVYVPLNESLFWLLRNLSILLENTPVLQTLAGSIMIHAQKPPRLATRPGQSLCEHESLKSAVSVVIPCHNEEMNIVPLINQLKRYYGDYLHEIIPVDDNSKDRTAEVMSHLAAQDALIKPIFRTPPNGVGRALSDGLARTTGRYVLCMDCDFQHLLPEVRDLFDAAAEGCDVAVGSRFSRHSVLLNYSLLKIIANRGFHVLAQILFRRQFRDLTNNLKLMRQEVVKSLYLTQPGFAVNAETGLQPLLMGYSVKEVPISWINRTPEMGVSSFRLVKVGGGYWQVLLQLWLKNLRGNLGGRSSQR
uniref:Glycosyl transferase family 2 n=1 Tax=Cyanothece sp. (strain PCC 7425 / ATCC 29141) TaxID=395961 RepID=B8HMN3_CYAP4